MNQFSKYLNDIKNKRKYTSAMIADLCGMDRTTVFKWVNGIHIPKDINMVEVMAEKLNLSGNERYELEDAYRKTCMGEEKFWCYDTIREILKKIQCGGNKTEQHISAYIVREFPDSMELHGKNEILRCISEVLMATQMEKNRKMILKMYGWYPEIFSLFSMYARGNEKRKCDLLQIMAFNDKNEKYPVYRLMLLNQILDMVAVNINVKTYTTNENIGEYDLTGNVFQAGAYMVQFNEDMEHGILTARKSMVNMYRDILQDSVRKDKGIHRFQECLSEKENGMRRKRGNDKKRIFFYEGEMYLESAVNSGKSRIIKVRDSKVVKEIDWYMEQLRMRESDVLESGR